MSEPTIIDVNPEDLTPVEEVETPKAEVLKAIDNENDPLSKESIDKIGKLISQSKDYVGMLESNWNASVKEFELKDAHMKQLYEFNNEHCTPMPDGLTEEEKEAWDRFNGLDKIDDETIEKIFGEGHPIIGVQTSQTIDRIKQVCNDHYFYLVALKEFGAIQDGYLQLIEESEKRDMDELRSIAEKETDPEKKAKMLKSIDDYYDRKYLKFMNDELTDEDIDYILKVYNDKDKLQYWLKRSQDKLKQLKIAAKSILELSQFEKRFLDEKYHKLNNIILTYYMRMIVYSNPSKKGDAYSNKVVCIIMALNGIIRNIYDEETKNIILNNVMAFLDRFIDRVKDFEDQPE